MRILFVAPYPISRIRIRSYGFVTHLLPEHDVTVIALCSGRREVAEVRELQQQGITVTAIHEPRYKQYLRSCLCVGLQKPLQVTFAAAAAWRTAIEAHIMTGTYDVLHVESIRALGALPSELPIPTLWDAVDCISHLYELGGRAGMTPLLRCVGKWEARRVRVYELEQLYRFRHVLVSAERERQALLTLQNCQIDARKQQHTFANIEVLSHGVDLTYFQRDARLRQSGILIFSGKMSYHANIAGALYFVKQILPLIWKQRPDVRLIIAGADPSPSIRRLMSHDARVQVTGYVADVRPYIGRAQVAVCPLPYAVGIQNKVLEAMALGTPVVASSCAVAGLQTIAGQDLLVADDPMAFAGEVLRLLENPLMWSRLAERGAAYVATYHNWDNCIRKLVSIYKSVRKMP